MGHSAFSGDNNWGSRMSGPKRMPEKILQQVRKLITNSEKIENNTGLLITYPFDEAVFPLKIAAPVITWEDTNTASKHWLIMVEFSSQHIPIYAFASLLQKILLMHQYFIARFSSRLRSGRKILKR